MSRSIWKYIEDELTRHSLSIRGQVDDDAVLCTQSKTYALRSVALSNNFLIVASDASTSQNPDESGLDSTAGETDSLVISGEVTEILELVPTVPRLESLLHHLRGCEYNDDESDEETYESNVNDPVRDLLLWLTGIMIDW